MARIKKHYKCDITDLCYYNNHYNHEDAKYWISVDNIYTHRPFYIEFVVPDQDNYIYDDSTYKFEISIVNTGNAIPVRYLIRRNSRKEFDTIADLYSYGEYKFPSVNDDQNIYSISERITITQSTKTITGLKYRLFIIPSDGYNSHPLLDNKEIFSVSKNDISITLIKELDSTIDYTEYHINYHNNSLDYKYHSIIGTDIILNGKSHNIRNSYISPNYSKLYGVFSDLAICQSEWGPYTTTNNLKINYDSDNKYDELSYYLSCLRFTTPNFIGISNSLRITMPIYRTLASDDINIRYALCTSDINRVDYINATSTVNDIYQISSGIFNYTIDNCIFNISIDILKPNTAYYLYLWPDESSTNALNIVGLKASDYSFTIYYIPEDTSSAETNFTITGISDGSNNVILDALKTDTIEYEFLGWDTDPSASIVQYSANQEVTTEDFNFDNDETVDLYAVWKTTSTTEYKDNTLNRLEIPSRSDKLLDTYEVIIDNNDGTNSIFTHSINSIAHYTFKGWASTPENVVNKIALPGNTEFTSDATVYAIWDEEVVTESIELPTLSRSTDTTRYNITLNPNNGSVDPSTVTAELRKVYEFEGWGTNRESELHVPNPYTPTKNITLYGNWNSYLKREFAELPIPTRAVHDFLGWSTVDGDINTFVFSPYLPEEGSDTNITLYANWQARYVAEPYIFHDGKWRKCGAAIRMNNKFNECV